MSATLQIELDQDECLSSGKCIVDQPGAFGFDDDELVVALPGLADLTDEQLVAAARRCPSGAILVFDGDTQVEL
jgi:ferredoxin